MHCRLTHHFNFCLRQLRPVVLLLALWCGMGMAVAAPVAFHQSAMTGGLMPFLDLQGEWRDSEGRAWKVPFQETELTQLTVTKNFGISDFSEAPDTVYLYLEAVAWKAEIWLNGRLLAVSEAPFAEHLLPLRKSWLHATGNVVEVRMQRQGAGFAYAPRRFLGIFRQAMLLQPDTLPGFVTPPTAVGQARKAVLVAPWSQETGFLYDTVALKRSLSGLFAYPYTGDPVRFAFAPGAQAMALVQRLGIPVLAENGQADSLAFFNAYPVDPEAGMLDDRFWRNADQVPTPAFGSYFSETELEERTLRAPDKVALLVLLLLPVLCMLLLKLIAPRQYSALPEYLTKTKIYLELIAGAKFLKDEQRWMVNLMRMLFTAVFVSLYIYYVDLSGDWGRLNILSSSSFLFHYFEGSTPSLYRIFLQVLGAVAGLNLAKYILLNIVSGIFRVHSLSQMTQNLDIFASFPLNLLPILPAAIIFFTDGGSAAIVLQVWHAFILIYLLRRFILIYGGLGKLFQFSSSLKFLYICTLEIAPWVFLI